MVRTRGKQAELEQQGVPPTPPQQLSTPRRVTKTGRVRKPRGADSTPGLATQPPASRGRVTRARTTSASLSDQTTQPVRSVPKRGRKAKANPKAARATQSTDEETTKAQPVAEAPHDGLEEDTSQAEHAAPRETPFSSSVAPVLASTAPTSTTPLQVPICILGSPGASSPMGVVPTPILNPSDDDAPFPLDVEPTTNLSSADFGVPFPMNIITDPQPANIGAPFPMNVESTANIPSANTGAPSPIDVEPSVSPGFTEGAPDPGDHLADMEPGLFVTDSEPSPPLSPSPSLMQVAPEYNSPLLDPVDLLEAVVARRTPAILAELQNDPEIDGNPAVKALLTEGIVTITITKPVRKKPKQKGKARVALETAKPTLENLQEAAEATGEASGSEQHCSSTTKRPLEIEQENAENLSSNKRVRVSDGLYKRVPKMYNEQGMLTLTAYELVPRNESKSSEEDHTDDNVKPLDGAFSQEQRRPTRTPVTPRPRGWGLTSFLPSAQTVTKYLPPLFRTPAASPAPPSAIESDHHESTIPSTSQPAQRDQALTPTRNTADGPRVGVSSKASVEVQEDDHLSRSGPHPTAGSGNVVFHGGSQPVATAHSRHRRESKSKHGLKTKGEKEEIRKKDEMIASLRAQLDAQNAQKADQTRKAAQAQIDIQAQVEFEAQKPASQIARGAQMKAKRRHRSPSPDIIPNPPGVSYGMDLKYFGASSSDDEDDDDEQHYYGDSIMDHGEGEVTPSRPSPSKKARFSGGPAPPIVGNPFRATPYTGTKLALPPLSAERTSPFDRPDFTNVDAEAEDAPATTTKTPPNGPTLTFRVPSPGDSDDEWDGPSYHEPSRTPPTTPQKSSAKSTRKQTSSEAPKLSLSGTPISTSHSASQGPIAELFPSSWKAPTSRQASQVPSIPVVPNLALDKARHNALKHQPQQPSRLRESSRLSTSTVGTEGGDDETNPVDKNPKAPNVTSHEDERSLQFNEKDSGASAQKKDNGVNVPREPSKYVSQADPMLYEPVSNPNSVSRPRASSPPIIEAANTDDEHSSDNDASEEELPDGIPSVTSYAEYRKTISPRVRALVERQWVHNKEDNEEETALKNELHKEAIKTFEDQFDDYEARSDESDKPLQLGDVSQRMRDYVNSIWTPADEEAAIERFNEDFESWLQVPA